jgi:TolB-like protein
MKSQEPNSAAVAGDISEAEQEYFCDGITDDVIYALSPISGLNVIGHTSLFVFMDGAQDVRDVGAKLGAGTWEDGTVRKSGDSLKVFTEMLDATTEEVLWAQTYERTLNDVFAVEAANRGGCSPSPADDVSPTDHRLLEERLEQCRRGETTRGVESRRIDKSGREHRGLSMLSLLIDQWSAPERSP